MKSTKIVITATQQHEKGTQKVKAGGVMLEMHNSRAPPIHKVT